MNSGDAAYIPRKDAEIVLQDFIAAAAVWQILTNSMALSTILMMWAVRWSENVWNVQS